MEAVTEGAESRPQSEASDAETLWADLPEPARRELSRIYADLVECYGPFGRRLTRRWAKLAAETLCVTASLSQEAAVLAVKRQLGRGRRPRRQHVAAAAKRQALQLKTLSDGVLAQLEDVTRARNGHRQPDADLAERLLAMPPLADPVTGEGEGA